MRVKQILKMGREKGKDHKTDTERDRQKNIKRIGVRPV